MTKLREPLTYKATLAGVANVIGWERCAIICGAKSAETVRRWSDPDCNTEIRAIDAEKLDRAFVLHGGSHAPFHRLHALRLAVAKRAGVEKCLADVAGAAARTSGNAIAALINAESSNDVRTLRKARQEIHEAVDSLLDGLAAIEGREKGGRA